MTDREKVIKGLELCGYQEGMPQCDSCPYDGKQCWKRLKTDALALLKAQEPHWISVEDGLPQERDTIFAKLYGTDKWRNGMFLKVSDDVRVVKVFRDGTKRVHHDHTVDGRWDSERKGLDVYGHVTHWMPNPELPFCTSRPTDAQKLGIEPKEG